MLVPSMLLLVLSLASPSPAAGPGSSAPASAEAPTTAPERDDIRVEVTIVNHLVGEDAEATADAVRRTVTALLQGRDFEVGVSAASRLEVVIERDEARDGIRMEYRTRAEGKPATTHTSVCERCGSDSLAATIAADLDVLSHGLTPALPVPAPTVTPSDAPQHGGLRPQKGRRIGPLGIVGASVGGAGLGVAIAGAVLAGIGDSSRVDPNNPAQLEIKRRRTPGFILLGAGASGMVIGAVLLGVDLGRRAKARRRGTVATHVHSHGIWTHMSFGSGGMAVRW